MQLLKVVALVLVVTVSVTRSADTSDYVERVIHIYQRFRTCAARLNVLVFDYVSGDDHLVTEEEGLVQFEKTEYCDDLKTKGGSCSETWSQDWNEANKGRRRRRNGMTEKQFWHFIRRNRAVTAIHHMVAAALEDIIGSVRDKDSNSHHVVEEDDILIFSLNLAEMAGNLRARDYAGCITILVPNHLGPFYKKAFQLWDIRPVDGFLTGKETKKVNDVGYKLFDADGDGKVSMNEFVCKMEEYALDPDNAGALRITQQTFKHLYSGPLVNSDEAKLFFEDVNNAAQEAHDITC